MHLKKIVAALAATAVLVGAPAASFGAPHAKKKRAAKTCEVLYNAQGKLIGCSK